MELILIQKVKNLGNLGDQVSVKAGYGRNYLVPYGKAVPATKSNIEAFEGRRDEYEDKARQSLSAADTRRDKLETGEVTIAANASAEGKLYGSVGPAEIAEAFTAAGIPVEKSEVVLGEGPLRRVGEFEVDVRLHADVQVQVKVNIVAE